MDQLVAHTSDGDIEFALAWPVGGSNQSGAKATRGSLRVSLRGTTVWHGADEATGFEWTWIELLEFLSASWLYLTIEDGTPCGVALDIAPRMLAASEAAMDSGSPLGSDVEREQMEAYRTTHDLAEAAQGAVMPPLTRSRAPTPASRSPHLVGEGEATRPAPDKSPASQANRAAVTCPMGA